METSAPPAWQVAQALPDGPGSAHRAEASSARSTAGLLVGSRLSPNPTGLWRVSGFRSGLVSAGSGPRWVLRNATRSTISSGVNTEAAPHGGMALEGASGRGS